MNKTYQPIKSRLAHAIFGRLRNVTTAAGVIIDVSKWQGAIDWTLVRTACDLAIIKVSESTFVDGKFIEYWRGSAGLPRTGYHFWRAGDDPVQQAKTFVNAVKNAGYDGQALWADMEDGDSDFAKANKGLPIMAQRAKTFLDATADLSGTMPGIYTAAWWWEPYLGLYNGLFQPRIVPAWSSNYWLWVASYTLAANPTMPRGWSSWLMWQYTSSAAIPGITDRVDVSRPSIPMADLLNLLGFLGGSNMPNRLYTIDPQYHPSTGWVGVTRGGAGTHGTWAFALEGDNIISAFDTRNYNNIDPRYHDGWVVINSLNRCAQPALKLPDTAWPTLKTNAAHPWYPATAYMSSADWNTLLQSDYVTDPAKWLFIPLAALKPYDEPVTGFQLTTTSNLNVRNAPATTGTILRTLPTGTTVTVIGLVPKATETWAQIGAGEWCAAMYQGNVYLK